MVDRRFNWKLLFIFLLLGILIWGIWTFFFSYKECDNWNCFNENLERCNRAKFIGEKDMIFEYIIHGNSGSDCEVEVELLQGELDDQDSIKLERQKMTCMLPKGVIMIPESDIGNCHGTLKEGLQDLIIKKLYTYLVQNIGKINLEVLDIPNLNGN